MCASVRFPYPHYVVTFKSVGEPDYVCLDKASVVWALSCWWIYILGRYQFRIRRCRADLFSSTKYITRCFLLEYNVIQDWGSPITSFLCHYPFWFSYSYQWLGLKIGLREIPWSSEMQNNPILPNFKHQKSTLGMYRWIGPSGAMNSWTLTVLKWIHPCSGLSGINDERMSYATLTRSQSIKVNQFTSVFFFLYSSGTINWFEFHPRWFEFLGRRTRYMDTRRQIEECSLNGSEDVQIITLMTHQ